MAQKYYTLAFAAKFELESKCYAHEGGFNSLKAGLGFPFLCLVRRKWYTDIQ